MSASGTISAISLPSPGFRFGDLICWQIGPPVRLHDEPIMFIAPCFHPKMVLGDIDIMMIDREAQVARFACKDGSLWQLCPHFEDEQ